MLQRFIADETGNRIATALMNYFGLSDSAQIMNMPDTTICVGANKSYSVRAFRALVFKALRVAGNFITTPKCYLS